MISTAAEESLVIGPTDADRLVEELTADNISGELRGALAPLKPNLIAPNSPLEVDRLQGTLIADLDREAPSIKIPKAQKTCDKMAEDRQLRPMRADSLVAGKGISC